MSLSNCTGPVMGFTSTALAIPIHSRVSLSAGVLALSSSTDTASLGTAEREAFVGVATDTIPVRLRNAPGTQIMIASGAITAGNGVYAATGGQVASSGTQLVGIALTSTSSSGDWLEVLPSPAALTGTIARTSLTQDTAIINVPFTDMRSGVALLALVPTSATSTLLGLTSGTLGTSQAILTTEDSKTVTTTSTARFQIPVPANYVAGQAISIVANAGMQTAVADTTATLGFAVYDETYSVTANIGPDAQSINSLTAANKTFTITPTNVNPGDLLDVLISIAIVDAAGGTAVHGIINSVKFSFAVQG